MIAPGLPIVTPLVNGRAFSSSASSSETGYTSSSFAVQCKWQYAPSWLLLNVMTSGTLLRKAKQSKPNEKPKSTVVGAPNLRRILFRIRIHGGCDAFDTELFGSLCTRLPAIGKIKSKIV